MAGTDDAAGHAWGSMAWRDAAEDWAHLRLHRLGIHSVGGVSDLSIQRWSAVWRIPTDRGDVLLKQTTADRAAEGSIHAFCADAAPEHVDRPLAYDPPTARMLFADGGPTMGEASQSSTGPSPDAIASMVVDYAHLQHATIGRQRQAETAGLPAWDPANAAYEAMQQATILHDLPSSDLRRITAAQRDRLLGTLDAFDVSGRALAHSPIPYCIDHGDLWHGNVLVAPDGRHRFIDFGDAAWTHPFLSLMPLLFGCHDRWSLPGAFGDSLDHPSLKMIIDAYLQAWANYADLRELREVLNHALRLAPLRRSRAVITNFTHATSSDAHDLGPTPWTWLTAGTTVSARMIAGNTP